MKYPTSAYMETIARLCPDGEVLVIDQDTYLIKVYRLDGKLLKEFTFQFLEDEVARWYAAKRELQGERVNSFIGLPKSHSTKPLIGWRTWNVGQEYDKDITKPHFILKAAHVDIDWDGPRMTTNILPSGYLAPVALSNKAKFNDSRGDYGVYCYKNLYLLQKMHGFVVIFGRIHCTGQVIEHEYGYRAQTAIIQELWIIDHEWNGQHSSFVEGWSEIAQKQFEIKYGCSVHLSKDLDNTLTIIKELNNE